jgi:hypothetical protein
MGAVFYTGCVLAARGGRMRRGRGYFAFRTRLGLARFATSEIRDSRGIPSSSCRVTIISGDNFRVPRSTAETRDLLPRIGSRALRCSLTETWPMLSQAVGERSGRLTLDGSPGRQQLGA